MADPYDTPGYRYSVNEFPGDGTTINWNIQFAGRSPGYISIDHVRASVIDEDGVETPITLSQSNFIQPTLLRIEPAVPAGSVLRVWRDTPKDEPLLDYNDGALMTERNLDTSFDQAVYAAAEMVDRAADSLEDVAEFSAAVLDRLADVEDTSNTALSTSNTALSTANAAAASAASAVSTANDALAGVVGATEAADLATAAANAANAAAAVATTAANNAEQAAQDSLDTAAAALTTASNAQAVALGIDSKAQDALDAAAAAVATANAAESTANGIDAKATQALEDSADALSAAETALNTAYLRRGALPADTVHNLNDWGVNEIGIWYQGSSASATLAQNYPVATAGILEILPRTPDFGGRVVQRYTRYLDGRTYTRSQTNAGTWSSWERFDTVSERDSALSAYATTAAMNAALAAYAPLANLEWLSKPIGEPFPLWDHIPGCPVPPTNDPRFRFIKLTAADGYNSGVLIAESVSGTAPLVSATGQISMTASPINGATVRLINTEARFLRAGVSGTMQNDALQNITGTLWGSQESLNGDGVFMPDETRSGNRPANGSSSVTVLSFDASRVARTANETRGKNIQATYYMRIR